MTSKNVVLRGADPERAALRLLIVPHAGAGAASGQPFAEHAPDDWLVATVRLPGRESRIREAVPGLDGLAADAATAVRDLPGTAPLLVVGVCSGAVIALEALRRHGTDGVAGLVVVSQWAVHEKPDPSLRLPHDTGDRAALLEALRAFGGVPRSLAADPEMLDLVLPAIVADVRAVEDHVREPFDIGVPLLGVFGDEDALCPEERTEGWSLFSRHTRTVWVPGGHLLLADEPAALAQAITGHLDHWGLG